MSGHFPGARLPWVNSSQHCVLSRKKIGRADHEHDLVGSLLVSKDLLFVSCFYTAPSLFAAWSNAKVFCRLLLSPNFFRLYPRVNQHKCGQPVGFPFGTWSTFMVGKLHIYLTYIIGYPKVSNKWTTCWMMMRGPVVLDPCRSGRAVAEAPAEFPAVFCCAAGANNGSACRAGRGQGGQDVSCEQQREFSTMKVEIWRNKRWWWDMKQTLYCRNNV